jgi:hypothetical protein
MLGHELVHFRTLGNTILGNLKWIKAHSNYHDTMGVCTRMHIIEIMHTLTSNSIPRSLDFSEHQK